MKGDCDVESNQKIGLASIKLIPGQTSRARSRAHRPESTFQDIDLTRCLTLSLLAWTSAVFKPKALRDVLSENLVCCTKYYTYIVLEFPSLPPEIQARIYWLNHLLFNR